MKTKLTVAWFYATHRFLPLLFVALALGCRSGDTPGKATLSGGRAASDGFAISGPSLLIRDGEPGLAFGTYGVPGSLDAMGYFIVFKYPPGSLAQSGFAPRSSARSEGTGLFASLDLDLHGARLGIIHRLVLNEARTSIASETLSIQDQAVDVSAGRFFYLDLTTNPPRIEQKKVALPEVSTSVENAEDAERALEDAARALATTSPEIGSMVSR